MFLDIAHLTEISMEGKYVEDELKWEFDSKKLNISTNYKKNPDVTDIENGAGTEPQPENQKLNPEETTPINNNNMILEKTSVIIPNNALDPNEDPTPSHQCCGVINVDDEDGILKMHQMLFKR